MERLHEQRPEDGFFSLEDYVQYHHLHFGMRKEIVFEGLKAALEKDCNYEWAEKYRYYVGMLISVYRKSARMERVTTHRPVTLDYNASILMSCQQTHDDHERPLESLVPLTGVVFDFQSLVESRDEAIVNRNTPHGHYTIHVTAVEGYDGPEWYRQLGHRGKIVVSMGGLVTPHIADPWG